MEHFYILCVDDEADVLDAVSRAIAKFESAFPIELARSAQEARLRLHAIHDAGDQVAVILCDHVMPEESGIDFLSTLSTDPSSGAPQKILLTGQATHEDTINAINQARVNAFIAKPWNTENLKKVLSTQLALYFVHASKAPPQKAIGLLDPQILSEAAHRGRLFLDY